MGARGSSHIFLTSGPYIVLGHRLINRGCKSKLVINGLKLTCQCMYSCWTLKDHHTNVVTMRRLDFLLQAHTIKYDMIIFDLVHLKWYGFSSIVKKILQYLPYKCDWVCPFPSNYANFMNCVHRINRHKVQSVIGLLSAAKWNKCAR